MIHVFLAIHLVLLIIGAFAGSYCHHMRRISRAAYLKDYTLFIVLWNLLILGQLVFGYTRVGLFPYQSKLSWPPLFLIIDSTVRCLLLLGVLFSFIKFAHGLEAKDLSAPLKIIFCSALTAVAFMLGAGTALFLIDKDISLLATFRFYMMPFSMLVLVGYLAVFVINNRSNPVLQRKKRNDLLVWLYLPPFLLLSIIYTFSLLSTLGTPTGGRSYVPTA